ncbi:MAG: hypothetical protein E6J02_04975 [Chloroflexi bacterium]|nr:MAG: hypothetical protein E6J02_04975 [Chloroflexota bacterium]
MSAIVHFGLLIIGAVVIIEGVGLAVFPKALGFLAGPGATKPAARSWTRYQGLGFMLLGAALVIASARGDLVPVVVLAMVACLMFSLAVLGRSRVRY